MCRDQGTNCQEFMRNWESWFVASSFQIAALVLNMFALAVITFRFFRTAYARRLTQVKYQGEQMANIVV